LIRKYAGARDSGKMAAIKASSPSKDGRNPPEVLDVPYGDLQSL
jgi:hypothetical protein